MKRLLYILLLPALLVTVTACRPDPVTPDNPKEQKTIACLFERTLPEDVTDLTIQDELLTIRNITTGQDVEYKTLEGIKLAPGLYNLNYTTNCHYKLKGSSMEGRLVAQIENMEVTDQTTDPLKLRLELRIVPTVQDFVIQEIFFTGTLTPAGKQYHGTSYVVLYNGTDKVLYADGVAFCESGFNSARKFDYKPDIRQEAMAVQAVYVIPGSGKEHPVKPGERLILCDIGIDHKVNNPNAFDLSKADFEWYDESSVPTHQDFDSPTVPNLDKWYCYTKSFFILFNRGFASYAIARMPITKEKYLKDYKYDYTYVLTHNGNSYDMSGSCYKLPNDWIIDGVNCSVEAVHQWTVRPETIDAGYTNCGTVDGQEDRYFHSVRRKYLGKDAEGRMILQDTNNSFEDFNPLVTASLIEEQGTAINAKGTPCTTKTYDGVVPIEQ